MSIEAERREALALDRRILAFIDSAARSWQADARALGDLLLEVFAHQARWNAAYARYAAARGAFPDRLSSWTEIPPVPARAFGSLRMATFPAASTIRTFRSSGTSGGARAALELDTLALYDASLLPAFTRNMLPDRAVLHWVALVPDPDEARDSSLAYMIGSAARQLAVKPIYCVRDGRLDLDHARAMLANLAAAREPVLILGTAIALLELTDALGHGGGRLELAPGSRVMETGGFKSSRRAVDRHVLYAAISERLGIPDHAIVGEYGMTEMVSQFYDSTLRDAETGTVDDDPRAVRRKDPPPWVLTRVVDPLTLEPVAEGKDGVLMHFDPAARSSAVCLLTEDHGRRIGRGFELLGRMPKAAARGCSLALDDLLRQDVAS